MPDNKELIGNNTERTGEKSIMVDMTDVSARVPETVKTWMQKIEEDPQANKTITDDTGQVVMQPVISDPKTKLPTTRAKFLSGLKLDVGSAGRWLSAFVLRLIKIKQGKAEFRKEEI